MDFFYYIFCFPLLDSRSLKSILGILFYKYIQIEQTSYQQKINQPILILILIIAYQIKCCIRDE